MAAKRWESPHGRHHVIDRLVAITDVSHFTNVGGGSEQRRVIRWSPGSEDEGPGARWVLVRSGTGRRGTSLG